MKIQESRKKAEKEKERKHTMHPHGASKRVRERDTQTDRQTDKV